MLELKQNCTKIYVKETFFCEKGFSFVPVLKKMYFFKNIQAEAFFFCKKNYSKNQSHGIQSAENIFSFLKSRIDRGIYVLCFKASKILGIGQVMRVL